MDQNNMVSLTYRILISICLAEECEQIKLLYVGSGKN